MKKVSLLTIAVFFVSSFLFAQLQSGGAIQGTVQDFNGDPVPGVTITASSPSLIGGSASTFTDQTGFYRFPYLAS
jgi:hypothetical protein